MVSEFLLYGSVLIAIALGFIVAALVILYVRLLRETNKLRDEKARLTQEAQKQAEAVLAKAQETAEQTVREAHTKAAEIIRATEVLSTDSKNAMLAELEQVSAENVSNFKQALDSAKTETVSVLENVSKELKSQALNEVESFQGVLKNEIVSSQNALRDAVNTGYKKIEEEIQRYRVARMVQVDNTIFEILREVTSEIIGKAISFEEHEELVKKSLEEAKRQNIFASASENTQKESSPGNTSTTSKAGTK